MAGDDRYTTEIRANVTTPTAGNPLAKLQANWQTNNAN